MKKSYLWRTRSTKLHYSQPLHNLMHLFFRSSCPFIHNWISELKSHFFSLGLDPARPLVENKSPGSFRLTKNDADVVQIIQTNAGTLGQLSQSGTLNYCVNGGREQPYCKGHSIRKFMSTNYYFTIFISLVHPLCMRQFSLKRCGFNCEAQVRESEMWIASLA